MFKLALVALLALARVSGTPISVQPSFASIATDALEARACTVPANSLKNPGFESGNLSELRSALHSVDPIAKRRLFRSMGLQTSISKTWECSGRDVGLQEQQSCPDLRDFWPKRFHKLKYPISKFHHL